MVRCHAPLEPHPASMKAVGDGQFSLEEIGHLDALQTSFGLTPNDVVGVRLEAYARAFAVAKADGRITSGEESDLLGLQSCLGLGHSKGADLDGARLAPYIARPPGRSTGVARRFVS